MKRDFIINELLLYPYSEIKDAVALLRSNNEPLTADEISFVHARIKSALDQHDEPEAPLSALRHLAARLQMLHST
ncbi:hypothetical protein WDK74_22035 [Escherichia coli]